MSSKAAMYDDSLYTPSNGDTLIYDSGTDKFVPAPPSTGVGLTPITYAALVALAGSSNLVPGAFYEITDYQTSHYIQYSGPVTGSGGIGGEEVNIGPVEPLIVQAVSYSEISIEASSTLYPDDTIYYLLSVADYDYDYAIASGKGCIIYREDTVKKLARDYDWRNVVFRRWETSPGSGDYFSCLPVIGSAYQDVNAFNLPDVCYDVYIKSPLDNPSQFLLSPSGTNYWLDNTVFNANSVTNTKSNLAYLNHVTGFSGGLTTVNECTFDVFVNNTIATEYILRNTVGSLLNNSFIQTQVHTFLSNINAFENNSVSTISLNTVSGYFSNNTANLINANMIDSCVGNNCLYIDSNVVDFILENRASGISSNITSSLISNNTVLFIRNNDCPSIEDNIGIVIDDNITTSSIEQNMVRYIAQNVCGGINSNVGEELSYNTYSSGLITSNTCNIIIDNTNTGDIIYNTGYYISNNNNTGNISSNICNIISDNSNTGSIGSNICFSILTNTSTSNISNNKVYNIESNSCGLIRSNNGFAIRDNVTTGSIIGNTFHIIADNADNCTIQNNNVYSISNNQGTSDITLNNGYLLEYNAFDSNFGNNNFHSFDNNTFGNSAGANVIQYHNFLDSITTSTVTPTVDMSSTTPTKSMYDVNLAQHYEISLAAGTLSYTAIT